MTILGIEEITYIVTNIDNCRRFMIDWGLKEVLVDKSHIIFETLNGTKVILVNSNTKLGSISVKTKISTIQEIVWGVSTSNDLTIFSQSMQNQPGFFKNESTVGCKDPDGLSIRIKITKKHNINIVGSPSNIWGNKPLRVDKPSPIYDRAYPIEISHIGLFASSLDKSENFYCNILGFKISDFYPKQGSFMRCALYGTHHNLFLLQSSKDNLSNLNHVAFTLRDLHEVFGGGLYVSRCGWTTKLGPGRHPISSAYFWYFVNPAGALIEYCADQDYLTPKWKPRSLNTTSHMFAEWAIDGGINGFTRRQFKKNNKLQEKEKRFITE